MDTLFEINNKIERKDLAKIHDYSCKILEEAGMKFLSGEILDAIESEGGKIDRNKSIAFIPKEMVEDKIFEFSKEIKSLKEHLMLNGGVAYDVGDKIFCKFGSIAPNFFDWDKKEEREATEKDLVNSLKLGQAVEEVGMVGCPMYIKKLNGKQIDPNFTPIINAMFLAKHTTKLGNSEVNSPKQLKYLMEMGIVLRGSLKEYRKNPIFLTAKESISPLLLDKNACRVLIALARNGLPATMIPMPILGASVPVTVSGAAALTNAEILATMVAIRCVVPGAMVGGGSMASYMDMSGKGIKFNVMDAIKVDMVLSQLFKELYGLDYGFGIYSSDAKALGGEVLIERVFKILGAFLIKKYNYVIGLFDQGMVFSPELALAEIEIIKAIHELNQGFDMDDLEDDKLLSEIKNTGHGGNFMASKHTLDNFRDTMRLGILEEVFDLKNKKAVGNIYQRANSKYKEILKDSHYGLEKDKREEIDRIARAAYEDIVGQDWPFNN